MHSRDMAVVEELFAEARRRLADPDGTLQPVATPVLVVATEEDIRAAALTLFHSQERKSASEDRQSAFCSWRARSRSGRHARDAGHR